MQLKDVLLYRYKVSDTQLFVDDSNEIECQYVDDYLDGDIKYLFIRWILRFKKRKFLRLFSDVSIFESDNRYAHPQEVCALCAEYFLKEMEIQKDTVIGIIDGEVLNRKIWIKMIRKRLSRLNGLIIFSEFPECFQELMQDATELYGLIVIVARKKDELCFCDYVLDFSKEEKMSKIVFRKPCVYYMAEKNIRVSRMLRKMNKRLVVQNCEDFAQKRQFP